VANVLDTVITIVIGTITGVVNAVTTTVNVLQDFFYVKVSGVSFIVLGSRQTGKTTLIEWLKHNMNALGEFNPDPTAAGGDAHSGPRTRPACHPRCGRTRSARPG